MAGTVEQMQEVARNTFGFLRDGEIVIRSEVYSDLSCRITILSMVHENVLLRCRYNYEPTSEKPYAINFDILSPTEEELKKIVLRWTGPPYDLPAVAFMAANQTAPTFSVLPDNHPLLGPHYMYIMGAISSVSMGTMPARVLEHTRKKFQAFVTKRSPTQLAFIRDHTFGRPK